MRFRLAVLVSISAAGPALAQSAAPVPTALPFLEISPAPGVLGLGGADVAHLGAGAHAALGNPALAGLAARDLVAATAGGPGANDWRSLGDIRFSGGAQSFGLDGSRLGVPLTFGAALAWTSMDYGDRSLQGTQDTYAPIDRFAALSVGGATRGAVRVAMGATVRHLSTTDRVTVSNGRASVSSRRGVTADLGLAASADLAAVAGSPEFALPGDGRLRPALEITAGYAQTHVGGTMRYSGGEAAALPRTARLGWSAVAGIDLEFPAMAGALRVLEGEIVAQAETRLVRENADGDYSYAPALGDVGALDALAGRGDATVTGRRGIRVGLLETVAISRGWFGGAGFENTASRAVEVRLAGPLKLAAAIGGSRRLADTAGRLDLRWIRAVTFIDSPFETTMNGFSLIVRR
jgi:hypothetical protein